MTERSERSPLSEAETTSLDEFFSRRPPYDAETLQRIKQEFRRLRERMVIDAQAGKTTKAARTKQAKSTSVSVDLFAAEDLPGDQQT